MAKIKTIRPIESISGKLKKQDEVGFALRKASKKNFTVTREDWTMKYKTSEKATAARVRQLKFKTVSLSAHERMTDPNRRQMDQAAFAAQSKYKTLFGYLFHLEWESYEE